MRDVDSELRSCMKFEVAVPNSPYGFCGRKATLNLKDVDTEGAFQTPDASTHIRLAV